VAAHHLCRRCDGTGWVLYSSETVDGEFEDAYRLCPDCYAPRRCMGSETNRSCPRPGTVRCGLGYYCTEHIEVIRNGGTSTTHQRNGRAHLRNGPLVSP
jgi:hypothetical protein